MARRITITVETDSAEPIDVLQRDIECELSCCWNYMKVISVEENEQELLTRTLEWKADLIELTDLVSKSIERVREEGRKESKIIIADRYKEELLEQHRKLTNCEPTTFFGLPLEFKNLPSELIGIVESEAEDG